jgi:hypothetical protein
MIEIDLSFPESEHEIEQALAAYRIKYDASSAAERQAAKQWIAAIVELEQNCPSACAIPSARICLRFMELFNRGNGDWKRVTLPAFIVLNALQAWERGELYLPTMDDILNQDV